jgi:hypothetical protein
MLNILTSSSVSRLVALFYMHDSISARSFWFKLLLFGSITWSVGTRSCLGIQFPSQILSRRGTTTICALNGAFPFRVSRVCGKCRMDRVQIQLTPVKHTHAKCMRSIFLPPFDEIFPTFASLRFPRSHKIVVAFARCHINYSLGMVNYIAIKPDTLEICISSELSRKLARKSPAQDLRAKPVPKPVFGGKKTHTHSNRSKVNCNSRFRASASGEASRAACVH